MSVRLDTTLHRMEVFLMTIDTNTMISITEANQNFSKVTRLVDERGTAVILKNNVPRYLVIDFSKADERAIATDEDVLAISKRLLAQNKEAYEVLAK
jgi:antitoxin Phd